jgi:molecular chaperone DnaJ
MEYYRILQVARDAEPEVIEKAYKALSMKYHPDRAPSGERHGANARMRRLNEAYAVLREARTRAEYDATLPSPAGAAWDEFWEKGLVGLFVERFRIGR